MPTKVQPVIHILPQGVVMVQKGVGCSDHQSCNPTPIPSAGTSSKIETRAFIQAITNVKIQQPTIIRMDQDAPGRFRHIKRELGKLLIGVLDRQTSYKVSNLRQLRYAMC